ncbi:Uncharacterized protein FWK35_00002932 [Aphis craccivora]|uniref:Uncharacterized protein n=1 Tax=Aphis craccivora TaxID=307492 RepID=A0A6G0ZJI5_APHCR|nr:Uncharacterized protein FWK35_00002932 [Aphis craccivora]
MSNINSNSHTSKLRSNESSKYRFQDRPNSDSVASGCLQNSNPKTISELRQNKCGGRGMAIQQLSESMSLINRKNDSHLDFSNSNIERHFKNLKEENLKKLKEENEKIWGNMIRSNKSS